MLNIMAGLAYWPSLPVSLGNGGQLELAAQNLPRSSRVNPLS